MTTTAAFGYDPSALDAVLAAHVARLNAVLAARRSKHRRAYLDFARIRRRDGYDAAQRIWSYANDQVDAYTARDWAHEAWAEELTECRRAT